MVVHEGIWHLCPRSIGCSLYSRFVNDSPTVGQVSKGIKRGRTLHQDIKETRTFRRQWRLYTVLHEGTFIVYVLANISESVREEVVTYLWLKNSVMNM